MEAASYRTIIPEECTNNTVPSFEETTSRMAVVFCGFEETRNINKRSY
jgi:hypothetical protein